MLHHTRRWNRDHTDELHSAWLNGVGDARLGERLRRVGRLERARPGAAAGDDGRAAAVRGPADARRVDAARRVRARTRRSSARAGATARRRSGRSRTCGEAFAGPVSLDGRELEVELPAQGIAAFIGADGVDGRRRRLACLSGARDRARARAGRPRRGRARRLRRGPAAAAAGGAVPACARPGPTARRRTSRSGSRCRRGCTTSPRSSGPAPAGRFAIGVREVTGVGGAPLTGLTLAEARAYAAARGRAAADRGRVAARRRGRPARARRAARLELDGERAPRRADALRDPQGRLRLEGRGLGLVRRRRPAGARLLAEAAARRRRCSARRASASGWRSTCHERARGHPGRRGGDALRRAARRDAPRRLRRRRDQDRAPAPAGPGPRARPEQGRRGAVVQGAGAQQAADHARPLEARRARRLPPARGARRRRARELPPGHARALGRRPGRALGRQPAARARARERLRADRPVRAARRVRHARRGDERLRGAERRARRRRRCCRRSRSPTASPALATAFAILVALRAREQHRPRPGRRHLADRAADDAARPAAHRLRPARRAAAAHRQPLEPQRAAQRLPHGRRRAGSPSRRAPPRSPSA